MSGPKNTVKFEECLRAGERFQNHYLNELDLTEWNASQAVGCFKDWDICLTHKTDEGRKIYFEVKSDTRAATTGNLAIEFACSGNDSGIYATKADWWVHYIPTTNTYYLIEVKRLRKIIAKRKPYAVNGGDGGRASMFLVPVSWLARFKHTTINPC